MNSIEQYKIGLYISIRLTAQTPFPQNNIKPYYINIYHNPYVHTKLDVFKFSISSLAKLQIYKIYAHVEIDKELILGDFDIEYFLRLYFPQASICIASSRPCSKSGHLASLDAATELLGSETPTIFMYNHDHIFVDYCTRPFLQEIYNIFENTNTRHDLLKYSHAPESISQISNINAHNFRLSCQFGTGASEIIKYQKNSLNKCSITKKGGPDSIFVALPGTVKNIWRTMISSTEYAPRLDWPKNVFSGVHTIHATSREFFRHFDGYGHVTHLNHGLGLQVDKLPYQAIVETISAVKSNGNFNNDHLKLLTREFKNIFRSLYTLALRDELYKMIALGNHTHSGFEIISNLIRIFEIDYINNFNDSIGNNLIHTDKLINCSRQSIFSISNELVTECISDCHNFGAYKANSLINQMNKK